MPEAAGISDGSFPFVPQGLAVEAMRDNGYKSTAHAIAELIDNSVQAGARLVQVFCVEEAGVVTERQRHRVVEIVVLDDGAGMDEAILRTALQFGNGTHLNDRTGIGRFGMGLPSASISQCRRMDVWTWQSGPDNAIHTFLDLDDIRTGALPEVPAPTDTPVPDHWRELTAEPVGESGTLISWTELDRTNWRGASAMLAHTEMLIGRMYRKFIAEQGVVIRLVAVRDGEVEWERNVRPNDPLYLMAPTSTPDPFGDKPMFRPWGEDGKETVTIEIDGQQHDVTLTFSWATDEARLIADGDAGNKPYGKHAAKNLGVSLVRADRELHLDPGWATDSYYDRWWGVEVSFPPALDEVFGVTNNKQAATHFSEMADLASYEQVGAEKWSELREEWKEEGDTRALLAEVVDVIIRNRHLIRQRLKQQTAGRRTKERRHDEPGPEDRASSKIKERVKEGHTAETVDEPRTEESVKAVHDDLVRKGYPEVTADEIARAVVRRDLRVIFAQAASDTDAFFWQEAFPGVLQVNLNTRHPTFDQLFEALEDVDDDEDALSIRERLGRASDTLKLMLAAWSRYESESRPESSERRATETARKKWGEFAAEFLRDSEEA